MTQFGLKELYEVIIRATYPIEVSGKTLEPGEIIAAFDKIQIANVQEIRQSVAARGSWDNRGLVFWDSTREVQIRFTEGIFSSSQFALMTNAQLIDSHQGAELFLRQRDAVESTEEGLLSLTKPALDPIFVYKVSTGEKLAFEQIDETTLQIEEPYVETYIDYSYEYENNHRIFTVGKTLTDGFLTLEGRTRVKDDITGQTHTGILYIPRLKLMSDLSMRLGHNATPQVGSFDALALPTGERLNTSVMKVFFLDDDIDSDM